MNVLTLEDLLEVSMFRCRICHRRLQYPVLQVGTFGNICGGICYERSAFTDAIPNVDVETLLAKLQVPCNYKERGCTYDGCYYNTCEHERVCEFRDKICPLTYLGKCDDVMGLFHDIPAHISSCHAKFVLIGEMNSPIKVPNPTQTNRDLFYLLSLDDKKFLLRTWLDSQEDCIFYTFYYYNNDIRLKNAQISLNIRWENTIFNIAGVNVRVQPETAIELTQDSDNAVKIPAMTLKSLNSSESVEILIDLNDKPVEPLSEYKRIQSVRIKCTGCSEIQDTILFCKQCNSTLCADCAKDFYKCSPRYMSHTLIDISKWDWLHETPCQNSGCNQIVQSNEYDHHKDVCLYRKHACPFQSCEQCDWQGLLGDIASHARDAHPKLINQNALSVQISKILFFVKDNNVFRLECQLSSDGNFTIKTVNVTAPACNDSYKWEIRVKRKDKPMMMVITDVCAPEDRTTTVNVKNYVKNGQLTLYADITSIG